MSPRHQVSRAAIELLKRFEGFRPRAAALPDGRWTIGHGHTLTAREGAEVSAEDAEALLIYDLIAVGRAVSEAVFAPLNANQRDALCSFVFNIGLENFRQSQVLRRLNEGSPLQAAYAMEMWRRADVAGERIVVDALVRRRAAEKALFLTPPDDAWPASPSPILRPLLDAEATDQTPVEPPEPVSAVFEDGALRLVRDNAPERLEEREPDIVGAAAEAVQSRFETLFPETVPLEAEEATAAAEPPPVEEEQEVPSQQVAPALRPQADFAPPITPGEPEPKAEEPPATGLQDVDFDDRPSHAPDVEAEEVETDPLLAATQDIPAYPFRRPLVVKPKPPPTGLAALGLLAVIGLAFFAGGLFWGFNASPTGLDNYVTPQAVGWLAGVAGVLMFGVAVFLLLERLGRVAEEDEPAGEDTDPQD